MIQRHFVERSDRAERSTDEVKFVLDDQIRWRERVPVPEMSPTTGLRGAVESPFVMTVDMPEEGTGLADPRQARKLVHRGDEKRGQAPVDGLVDGQHRQRAVSCEVTDGVRTGDHHVLRRQVAWRAAEALAPEGCTAPGARLDRGRCLASVPSVAPNARYSGVVAVVACLPETVRRGG